MLMQAALPEETLPRATGQCQQQSRAQHSRAARLQKQPWPLEAMQMVQGQLMESPIAQASQQTQQGEKQLLVMVSGLSMRAQSHQLMGLCWTTVLSSLIGSTAIFTWTA